MLTVHQLSIQRARQAVISHCSFRLEKQALLFITGQNGSGKTTLLRTIAGFSPPDGGEISWDQPTRIGYIGHELGLRLGLTVDENLDFAATLASLTSTLNKQDLVLQLGLSLKQLGSKYLSELSLGQRKRIALATLVLKKADIWILDEPYTGLDTASMGYIAALIDTQLETGSVILASHILPHRFSQQLNL